MPERAAELLVRQQRRRGALVACYLAALMVLGGGGSPAPLAELACELLAVEVLALWLVLGASGEHTGNRPVTWVIALVTLPVVVQLVPLPPALWQMLPGRETYTAALALIGEDQSWRSWSIAPHRTLAALLALAPPLLALWLTAQLERDGLRLVLRAVVGVALVSVAVGAAQLAQAGPGPLDFYGTGDTGVLHGFQANRNAEADVLLIGLLGLALTWRELHHARRERLGLAFLALAGLLLLGVVLTGSRTGIALAPVAAAASWAIVRSERKVYGHAPSERRIPWWLWAGVAGTAGLVGLWLLGNPALARVIARFDLSGEFRPELWRDAWQAAMQFWPFGSGVGTFTPSFLPYERLEVVDATLPNRAHNEVLEAMIEGGVPLLLSWAAATGLVAWHGIAAWRGGKDSALPRRWLVFSASAIVLVALHSLVDYPLRSVALASLVAVAVGITFSAGSRGLRAGLDMLDGE